mgnify:CR=1 FL=1
MFSAVYRHNAMSFKKIYKKNHLTENSFQKKSKIFEKSEKTEIFDFSKILKILKISRFPPKFSLKNIFFENILNSDFFFGVQKKLIQF